jgi:hypothetical protein
VHHPVREIAAPMYMVLPNNLRNRKRLKASASGKVPLQAQQLLASGDNGGPPLLAPSWIEARPRCHHFGPKKSSCFFRVIAERQRGEDARQLAIMLIATFSPRNNLPRAPLSGDSPLVA